MIDNWYDFLYWKGCFSSRRVSLQCRRSRAAFKLKQLDVRFSILTRLTLQPWKAESRATKRRRFFFNERTWELLRAFFVFWQIHRKSKFPEAKSSKSPNRRVKWSKSNQAGRPWSWIWAATPAAGPRSSWNGWTLVKVWSSAWWLGEKSASHCHRDVFFEEVMVDSIEVRQGSLHIWTMLWFRCSNLVQSVIKTRSYCTLMDG